MKYFNTKGIDKLHLGSGRNIKKGFINLDVTKLEGVDIVHDLNKYPYPFKNNTFNYILAEHVIEHLNGWIKCMEEIYRISKNGAIVDIEVPHFASVSAFMDPTHKNYFSVNTFKYFEKKHEFSYYFKCKFEFIKGKITFPKYYSILKPIISFFVNKFQGFYEANICYIIRPKYIKIRLKVKK